MATMSTIDLMLLTKPGTLYEACHDGYIHPVCRHDPLRPRHNHVCHECGQTITVFTYDQQLYRVAVNVRRALRMVVDERLWSIFLATGTYEQLIAILDDKNSKAVNWEFDRIWLCKSRAGCILSSTHVGSSFPVYLLPVIAIGSICRRQHVHL